MNVLYFEVSKEPTLIKIRNSNDSFQSLVEGYYEPILLDPLHKIYLVCNDEGRIRNLKINRYLNHSPSLPMNVVYGNFFICQIENGEFCSLNPDFIENMKDLFVK